MSLRGGGTTRPSLQRHSYTPGSAHNCAPRTFVHTPRHLLWPGPTGTKGEDRPGTCPPSIAI